MEQKCEMNRMHRHWRRWHRYTAPTIASPFAVLFCCRFYCFCYFCCWSNRNGTISFRTMPYRCWTNRRSLAHVDAVAPTAIKMEVTTMPMMDYWFRNRLFATAQNGNELFAFHMHTAHFCTTIFTVLPGKTWLRFDVCVSLFFCSVRFSKCEFERDCRAAKGKVWRLNFCSIEIRPRFGQLYLRVQQMMCIREMHSIDW